MLSKFREMMEGRNGIDQLGVTMFSAAMIMNLLVSLLGWLPLGALSVLFVALTVSRVLSKNLARRHAENYRFMSLWGDIRGDINGLIGRIKNAREYRYFNCPDCKSRLRVRRGKGKVQITCPRCGLRFIRRL